MWEALSILPKYSDLESGQRSRREGKPEKSLGLGDWGVPQGL